MNRILAAAAAALCIASTAAVAAQDPIATRQQLMKNTGASIGVLAGMAKGEIEFDAKKAEIAVRAIDNAAIGFPLFFPQGSETGGETRASPKIWENMADFMAKAADARAATEAVIAMPWTSLDELRAGLGEIGKTCQSCHEVYQLPKN